MPSARGVRTESWRGSPALQQCESAMRKNVKSPLANTLVHRKSMASSSLNNQFTTTNELYSSLRRIDHSGSQGPCLRVITSSLMWNPKVTVDLSFSSAYGQQTCCSFQQKHVNRNEMTNQAMNGTFSTSE
jgi:hypothetical protein